MSHFTCITCQVAFSDFEIQRQHYKSDWHRYNLKRKVAELPPVTAENFQQRVLAQRSQQQVDEKSKGVSHYCNFCGKHFGNRNAYDNHLKSRKHLEVVQKHEQQITEDITEKNLKNVEKSGLDVSLDSEVSVHQRKDVLNMMKKLEMSPKPQRAADTHALNVASGSTFNGLKKRTSQSHETTDDPDEDEEDYEEWDDVEGEPLGLEECLFCSFLSSDLEANLKHMTETHSFFIPDVEYLTDLEGLIGYLDEKVGVGNVCLWCNDKGKSFYSTKSVQQHMMDKGHCKILHEGPALEEYTDFYDYSSSYPVNDEESADPDDDVEVENLNDEGFQMVLPSGSVIGHRALMKYYRQNLPPERPKTNRRLLHSVMTHYRSLGWTRLTGQAALQKARDISLYYMRRSKRQMQQGVKNNKLQRHFRPQVLF